MVFQHVSREFNKAEDALAKLRLREGVEMKSWPTPPIAVLHLLEKG